MIKINKKTWTLTFLIVIFVVTSFNAISACQSCDDSNISYSSEMVGMMNPSAVYCTELGYEYKTIKTYEGESGVCVIPRSGEEFDSWEFLEGKVGHKYSYCARNGYGIETRSDGKNSFSSDYAVCIPKYQSDSNSISSVESMSVTNLMNLEEKVSVGSFNVINPEKEIHPSVSVINEFDYVVGIPNSFDWRNKDGQNWITPVKDQNPCGSCWAFAPIAAVEAKFNIVTNDPNFDVDLSEQYLVSDCLPGFYTSSGNYIPNNCIGGSPVSALQYIRDYGVTDEACYPYTANNSLCSDRCSLWNKRLWSIGNFGHGSDPEYTKLILTEYGPLVIYMAIFNGGDFDDDGIYRNSTLPLNHAVLLVGYDDVGQYWIAKNSWGTSFGDGGYFKIGYDECYVNYHNNTQLAIIMPEVYYKYPLPLPNPTPTPVPLPKPPEIPDPVPLPVLMTIPLPVPLPFFVPIPLPIPLL